LNPFTRLFGILGLCGILAVPAVAQRVRNANPTDAAAGSAPTVVGKVVEYKPGASIVIEAATRSGVSRREFTLRADKTKVELPPRIKELAVGINISLWADKDDPKLAARIGGANAVAATPRGTNPPNPAPRAPTTTPAAPVVIAPPKPARPPVLGLAPQSVAEQIDRHVQTRLTEKNIPASPACDDSEFIRRVFLDITGVIPPADRVVAFVKDNAADKRAGLVDELLADSKYGLNFADRWCDRIDVKDMPIYREPFVEWLAASFNANRGWDEIVYDLVTAGGSFNFITRGKRLGSSEPQALFVLLNTEDGVGKGPNPGWLAGESGRLFLGVQLQCAECHDHPFTDTWRHTDFWGLAAFFSGLRADRQGGELRWSDSAVASTASNIAIPPSALKNVGQIVPARLLGEKIDYRSSEGESLRHSLARWMTAKENPLFATAIANRTWSHFFGRGLVMPEDDIRPDNPPTHPEVLDLLAGELRQSNFDLKHLIRCLCLSAAYQRTSEPRDGNTEDQLLYSHAAIKTMSPGVFYDSLKVATGWPKLKVGLPEQKVKLTVSSKFTPREVFVDFFRSAQGTEADPLDNDHGIPQALKLMNAAQLSSVPPVVQRLVASGATREQIVEQLYLAALARRPLPAEISLLDTYFNQRRDVRADDAYAGVVWILINSAEFISNH